MFLFSQENSSTFGGVEEIFRIQRMLFVPQLYGELYKPGSMYGIFTYMLLILMVNVGTYTSPMDPMGNKVHVHSAACKRLGLTFIYNKFRQKKLLLTIEVLILWL